jgi:hypothetical protein
MLKEGLPSSLKATCLSVLQELHDTSAKLVFTQPTPFVFPWHGRNKQLDSTEAMSRGERLAFGARG